MPKTDGAPQEPASIRDALDQAYDEQTKVEEPEVTEEITEPETAEGERARGPDGKFVKTEEVKAEAPPVEAIEPEAHWSEEDKNAFRAIPPEHRKWVFERYKRVEADNTRKSQEAASLKKFREQFEEVIAPYRQEFQMQGMDEVSAIRSLFAIRDHLRKDPVGGFKWLAQQFGVDLAQLNQEQPQDPALQAVNQQFQAVTNKLQAVEQTIQQERLNSAWERINAFAQEKDPSGRLKHPHFEAVSDSMTQLMKAGIVPMGDLENAYATAVRLKPELSTPAPVAQVEPPKPDDKAAELEKAAKAAKAKKAAAGVSSGASAATDRKLSLREELEARVDGSLH